MAQSIRSRQAKVLDSGFLDLLGEDAKDYNTNVTSLDSITESLEYLAAAYVLKSNEKLEAAGKVSSGALSKSIIAMPVQILGKVYEVKIKIDDYFRFVDQGVKGWADEKGGSSPYQFKHYTGKGKGQSKMVEAIKKWLVTEGLQGKGKENAHKKASARSQFRHSIKDASLGTAIAISKTIRKKGLKPSHFWTDTETEIVKLAKEMFASAIKVDIINSLYGK